MENKKWSEWYQKGIEIFYDCYCFDGEEHQEEADEFACDYADKRQKMSDIRKSKRADRNKKHTGKK